MKVSKTWLTIVVEAQRKRRERVEAFKPLYDPMPIFHPSCRSSIFAAMNAVDEKPVKKSTLIVVGV